LEETIVNIRHCYYYLQYSETPLIIACDRGFELLAEKLIAAGADINALNNVSSCDVEMIQSIVAPMFMQVIDFW